MAIGFDPLAGRVGIAAGLFQHLTDFAGRCGQLGLVIGEQLLRLLVQGFGGCDVVRDLALAFVQGRGDLRPGERTAGRRNSSTKTRPVQIAKSGSTASGFGSPDLLGFRMSSASCHGRGYVMAVAVLAVVASTLRCGKGDGRLAAKTTSTVTTAAQRRNASQQDSHI